MKEREAVERFWAKWDLEESLSLNARLQTGGSSDLQAVLQAGWGWRSVLIHHHALVLLFEREDEWKWKYSGSVKHPIHPRSSWKKHQKNEICLLIYLFIYLKGIQMSGQSLSYVSLITVYLVEKKTQDEQRYDCSEIDCCKNGNKNHQTTWFLHFRTIHTELASSQLKEPWYYDKFFKIILKQRREEEKRREWRGGEREESIERRENEEKKVKRMKTVKEVTRVLKRINRLKRIKSKMFEKLYRFGKQI